MTQQQIDALAAAVTKDICSSFTQSKKRRYAARLCYNFMTAYESITGCKYAGEITIAELSAALRTISAAGAHEEFETIGAPLAFMRSREDKKAATFAEFVKWISYATQAKKIGV